MFWTHLYCIGSSPHPGLPAEAAAKLQRLREGAEEAPTILRLLSDDEMRIRTEIHEATAVLRDFDERAGQMQIRGEPDREWRDDARAERVAAVEDARARLVRVIARKSRHQHAANAALLVNVEAWLRRQGDAQIEPAPVAAAKLSKGSTPAAAVEAAETKGAPIARRDDASPAAVLGITIAG
jgi:hypothetical protein